MIWDEMGSEKKLVAGMFIVMFVTFLSMGMFMEKTVGVSRYGDGLSKFDGDVPIQYTQLDTQASSKQLKAIVKGSIYEEGSNMTVYGACFDGDSYLLPEANASFTAWYPNGSIMVGPNASMEKIYDDFQGTHVNGTGRWFIHVTMGDVVGTYLTEMRCEYLGEWAMALGEWQNPEWVVRIRTIDNTTQSIQSNLTVFQNSTYANFTALFNQLSNIDVSGGDVDSQSLEKAVRAIDANVWRLDPTNPFFVIGSDTHNYQAVDMLSPDAVAAVSLDGYYDYWDGETWSEVNSTNEYRGVSILPSNGVYAWAVGTDGASNPIVAVNGVNATTPSLPSGSPTAFNDVVLFMQPNDPSGSYYVYLLGNDGTVYYSNDAGSSYSDIGSVGAAEKGRFSDAVDNYDGYAQVDGYQILAGQGNTLLSHDGTTTNTFTLSGNIKDVSLLYSDYGFIVTEDTSSSFIYFWNGTNVTQHYEIEDAGIVPTGIEILSKNDAWVTTTNPAVFYHWDGRSWQYSTVGYSQAVSVVISFNGGGNTTTAGLQDISMKDGRHGYVVGQDGAILRFDSEMKTLIDNLETEILAINSTTQAKLDVLNQTLNQINLTVSDLNLTVTQIQQALDGNFTIIENALTSIQNNQTITQQYILDLNTSISSVSANITQIQTTLSQINTTMVANFGNLTAFLDSMNQSIQLKLDNILANTTYTQLYLETTLFPLINGTYENTLAILVKLGLIEGKINQTIQLQNQTLNIVNETATNVDELVNRSRRIRAWVTQ